MYAQFVLYFYMVYKIELFDISPVVAIIIILEFKNCYVKLLVLEKICLLENNRPTNINWNKIFETDVNIWWQI